MQLPIPPPLIAMLCITYGSFNVPDPFTHGQSFQSCEGSVPFMKIRGPDAAVLGTCNC